jgi:hypothetical protein
VSRSGRDQPVDPTRKAAARARLSGAPAPGVHSPSPVLRHKPHAPAQPQRLRLGQLRCSHPRGGASPNYACLERSGGHRVHGARPPIVLLISRGMCG